MAKHVWQWDRKSQNLMMVVCVRCGKRMALSEVLEVGCKGCPDKAASDKFDAYSLYVREHMTKEQAEFVRKLRVDERYSWRAVARRCYGNHRFRDWSKWDPPSNQIMGMALCERAAVMYGEDYEKEPWN